MYQVTMMNAVDADANLTTAGTIFEYPNGLNGCKMTCEKGNLSCEVVMTGNGTTGVVKLQACDSGVSGDYKDVENATVTLTAAGAFSFSMSNVMKKHYRLNYDKGNATTGAITATLTFS